MACGDQDPSTGAGIMGPYPHPFDGRPQLTSIAGTLDAIMLQLTRIADALTQAQPADEEPTVDVHGNPVPRSVFDAVKAMIDAGERPTEARLCHLFRQSPASMQHLIDDLTPEDEKCCHAHVRVVGTRRECMNCGEVLGYQGGPAPRHDLQPVIGGGFVNAADPPRAPGYKTPMLEQQATLEHDSTIEPTYTYDDTPGEPVTANEMRYARQARDYLQRCNHLEDVNGSLSQRVRDLEEQIVRLNKRCIKAESRKTLEDPDVDED